MTKTHSLHGTPTMLFELFCYALAIITVLLLRAETNPATVAATEPQPEPIEAPQPIEAKPEPQPIAQPAMPATIAPPVVSLTIPTESSTATESTADLAKLKTPELRKLCSQRGITWRNAHGKTHLRNAEMIQALMA